MTPNVLSMLAGLCWMVERLDQCKGGTAAEHDTKEQIVKDVRALVLEIQSLTVTEKQGSKVLAAGRACVDWHRDTGDCHLCTPDNANGGHEPFCPLR